MPQTAYDFTYLAEHNVSEEAIAEWISIATDRTKTDEEVDLAIEVFQEKWGQEIYQYILNSRTVLN
ncbi:MAG: hypothetical protein KME17_08115 [Cyanosarcina radialis HA8281-LM2]|jgi:cysteine sulfinate desulfinase/cysteine desulfurase-like protein|nr:hypothetical protein [Cyanosarcina radialis HA8281-LM2]